MKDLIKYATKGFMPIARVMISTAAAFTFVMLMLTISEGKSLFILLPIFLSKSLGLCIMAGLLREER